MSIVSSLRSIPSANGGGYGRVIEARALAGGSGATELVIQPISPALTAFSEVLKNFSGETPVNGAGIAALSSRVVTIVQQTPPLPQNTLPIDDLKVADSKDDGDKPLQQDSPDRKGTANEDFTKNFTEDTGGNKDNRKSDVRPSLQSVNVAPVSSDIFSQMRLATAAYAPSPVAPAESSVST
jgi:hypothetical protein